MYILRMAVIVSVNVNVDQMFPKQALRCQHLVEPDAVNLHRMYPTDISLSVLFAVAVEVIRHHLASTHLSVLVDLPVDDAAVTSAASAVAGKHFGHLLLGKLGAEPSGEVVSVGAGLVAKIVHSFTIFLDFIPPPLRFVNTTLRSSPCLRGTVLFSLLSRLLCLPPPLPHQLHILLTWQPLAFLGCCKKRLGRSEREMTTPLFLLRSVEIGISIQDLDLLTVGLVIDMWTEKANDGVKYNRVATQEDFDKF